MGKKKPHLRGSKLMGAFDIDTDVADTKKHPLRDGIKVYKSEKGYEVTYQERGAQGERKIFVTKSEAENYLRSLGRK